MEEKPILKEINFSNGENPQLDIRIWRFDKEMASLEVDKVYILIFTFQMDDVWEGINTFNIKASRLEIFKESPPKTIILDERKFYTLVIEKKWIDKLSDNLEG